VVWQGAWERDQQLLDHAFQENLWQFGRDAAPVSSKPYDKSVFRLVFAASGRLRWQLAAKMRLKLLRKRERQLGPSQARARLDGAVLLRIELVAAVLVAWRHERHVGWATTWRVQELKHQRIPQQPNSLSRDSLVTRGTLGRLLLC
jgi:hypothetical protein